MKTVSVGNLAIESKFVPFLMAVNKDTGLGFAEKLPGNKVAGGPVAVKFDQGLTGTLVFEDSQLSEELKEVWSHPGKLLINQEGIIVEFIYDEAQAVSSQTETNTARKGCMEQRTND